MEDRLKRSNNFLIEFSESKIDNSGSKTVIKETEQKSP